jgi:hypothetical protein
MVNLLLSPAVILFFMPILIDGKSSVIQLKRFGKKRRKRKKKQQVKMLRTK